MRKLTLINNDVRQRAIDAVRDAPDGWEVIIRPKRRSLDQNAKLHALIQEFDGLEFAGQKRSADDWKVILVSGHTQATKGESELVTGIEGEMVQLRESTARMSKERSSSLIEYIQAFKASFIT
jgi:hypothetical protein